MRAMNEIIEKALNSYINGGRKKYKEKVWESMAYSLLGGGKRIRPKLTLAFCSLCGGKQEDALPFACAVEMIHTYSLIHDDLPCMDNDEMRRGKPTNHIVYGEDMALLAGDGLLNMAFEIMLGSRLDPNTVVSAMSVMAENSGVNGMVGGQCIDLQSQGEKIDLKTLEAMDMGKTVALIRAACEMGVIIGGGNNEKLEAAAAYAQGVGMAFQIRDDILDVIGNAKELGKNTGMDAENEKCNYVSLLGPKRAQELVHEYTELAVTALNVFDNNGAWLKDFALEMENRDK